MQSFENISFAALEELNGLHTTVHASKIFSIYASMGLKVAPLNPEEGTPYDWNGTTVPEQAALLPKMYPECQPALLTGGDLVAIECYGEKARGRMAFICGQMGIPKTAQISSKNSLAYLFRSHTPIPCEAIPIDEDVIKIKGESGFTIAAPAKVKDSIYEIYDGVLPELPAPLIGALKGETHVKWSEKKPTETQGWSPGNVTPHPPKFLDLALEYAGMGIPVFPCQPDSKKPYNCRLTQERWGATTDPEIIKKYWNQHPRAIIGGVMGASSGLLAVDCDVKHGENGIANFQDFCAKNDCVPNKTRTVRTPSGGLHYLFKYPSGKDIPSSAGKLLPGVDIRANGGYLIMGGSKLNEKAEFPGVYRIENDVLPIVCPNFLVEALLALDKKAVQTERASSCRAPTSPKVSSPEALAALEKGCQKIAKCPEGSRNDTLNATAFYLGKVARISNLSLDQVKEKLIEAALMSGLAEREAHSAIESGLKRGLKDESPLRKIPIKLASETEIIGFIPGILSKYAKRKGYHFEKILPPNALQFLQDCSQSEKIPMESLLPILIALCSAAIGGRRKVRFKKGLSIAPNLFHVTIGEPFSRKSTTTKIFFKSLEDFDEKQFGFYQNALEKYKEEMETWNATKKSERGERPQKPVHWQVFLKDSTMEATIKALRHNQKGMFWYADEGNRFVDDINRYNDKGATNARAKLIAFYNNDNIVVNRVGKDDEDNDYYIKTAVVSLYLNLQPGLLPELFTKKDGEQGFAQRFLFNHLPERAPGTYTQFEYDEKEVDSSFLTLLTMKLVNLSCTEEEIALHYSRETHDFLNKARWEIETSLAQGNIKTYVLRLIDMLPRFALILHYLHWADSEASSSVSPDTELTREDFTRALELLNIYLLHLDRAFWLMKHPRFAIEKRLDPEQRKLARCVIENGEFFTEYRTVEEIEKEFPGVIADRKKTGMMLQKEDFPRIKKKGYPGKYLLHGLDPWKDTIDLQMGVFEGTDSAEPYAEVLASHSEELKHGTPVTINQMAHWLGTDVENLKNDENFPPAMDKLGYTIHENKIFRSPPHFSPSLTMEERIAKQASIL